MLLHNERFGGLAFGVATGEVFCGSIGNKRRAEYVMVGKTVVLAQRLMGLVLRKRERGSIIVDADTYRETKEIMSFETNSRGETRMEKIEVKGVEDLVETYRPSKEVSIFRKHMATGRMSEVVSALMPRSISLQQPGVEGFIDVVASLERQDSAIVSHGKHTGARETDRLRVESHRRLGALHTGLFKANLGSFQLEPGIARRPAPPLELYDTAHDHPRLSAVNLYMWPLCGREKEVQVVQAALSAFVERHQVDSELWRDRVGDATSEPAVIPTGAGAVILVEGAAGIGKTSLMKRTADLAQLFGFCVIDIPSENSAGGQGGGGSFNSWFQIMDALLGVGLCTFAEPHSK